MVGSKLELLLEIEDGCGAPLSYLVSLMDPMYVKKLVSTILEDFMHVSNVSSSQSDLSNLKSIMSGILILGGSVINSMHQESLVSFADLERRLILSGSWLRLLSFRQMTHG